MKVYEMMKADSYRHNERVALFTSKAKATGYLLGLLLNNPRAIVKTAQDDFLYGEDERKLNTRILLDRQVINVGEFGCPAYYVREVEVL